MNILQVLALLLLLTVPNLTQTQPSHDRWEAFGAYGPCSRTCGTGVAVRSRKCITSRTDGGHNCLGSSKSFRICNTHECPVGSKDFREEQCSQFDQMDFQGRRYTWLPYYGAPNPCELNCIPRGETFSYRHRPAVTDGTPCYVGRSEICVDGICRLLAHGEFLGLDDPETAVALPLGGKRTYIYKTGVYGECSAACDGGMQHRSVECLLQDPLNPRLVEESYCIAQGLLRPPSQQACNMHPCTAEYRVSSFSGCSVTCGEGHQTREVFCVGPRGERLADRACSRLVRPPAVQACRRPSCHTSISWHVTEYGLCTRSCSGGVRERRVGCFDTDLNPQPEERCGSASRPSSVEACNIQPCSTAQTVLSVQVPGAHEGIVRGFVPYVPDLSSASRPHPNTPNEPNFTGIGP
ncbi:hypothetical protein LDENG_00215830 [Lucifuga dentata]|nr:hypothetical protein LDENG_00215830 [Lucifuga dentata]